MASINSVVISGNLGKDPMALNETDDPGKTVIALTLAVGVWDRKKNEERAVWVDVIHFGKHAAWCLENLQKGSKVVISGRLDENRYKDKETGKERIRLKVVAQQVMPCGAGSKGSGGSYKKKERSNEEQNYGDDDTASPSGSGGSDEPQFEL